MLSHVYRYLDRQTHGEKKKQIDEDVKRDRQIKNRRDNWETHRVSVTLPHETHRQTQYREDRNRQI